MDFKKVMHIFAHIRECILLDFTNGLHSNVCGESCAHIVMNSSSFCVVGQQRNIRPVTDGVREGRWHWECLVLKVQVLWDVAPCQ
jgi:hypothetical protein